MMRILLKGSREDRRTEYQYIYVGNRQANFGTRSMKYKPVIYTP